MGALLDAWRAGRARGLIGLTFDDGYESFYTRVYPVLKAFHFPAVIAVVDSGPGIEPDQIERLLRPFERGDTARSGSGGAGLGLAIVNRIARAHHGQLKLSPNCPSGLRAQIRIPLAAHDR